MATKKMESYLIADAVSNACEDLEQLASEIRDWYDNLPESLQGGDKGERLNECADTLEQIQSIDVPTCFDDSEDEDGEPNPTPARVEVWPLPRKASRSARRDYAVSLLSAVKDHVENVIAEKEAEHKADPEGWEHQTDAESFFDELDSAIGYAEEAEFPGMYG